MVNDHTPFFLFGHMFVLNAQERGWRLPRLVVLRHSHSGVEGSVSYRTAGTTQEKCFPGHAEHCEDCSAVQDRPGKQLLHTRTEMWPLEPQSTGALWDTQPVPYTPLIIRWFMENRKVSPGIHNTGLAI